MRIPAKAGIQAPLFSKENGFPITTSGMTGKELYDVSYVKGLLNHYTSPSKDPRFRLPEQEEHTTYPLEQPLRRQDRFRNAET